jgi:CheY-like chemotaxis protein
MEGPMTKRATATTPQVSPRLFLLVEHEVKVAQYFELVLRKYGEVIVAHTMKAAIAVLQTHVFSALFIDLGLPDGGGLNIVETVREMEKAGERVGRVPSSSSPATSLRYRSTGFRTPAPSSLSRPRKRHQRSTPSSDVGYSARTKRR